MDEKTKQTLEIEESYLKFVKERVKNVDFHAEEKLRNIDELAEAIFIARESYRKKKQ